MKSILIAAGMAAMLLGAAPASAAPAPLAPAMSAPQDRNWDGRSDRRDDRRWDNRRGDRKWRGDRRWRGNDRRAWGWGKRCHSVRRHHRWVRVCR